MWARSKSYIIFHLFYQDDIPGFIYPVVLHLLQEGCEQRKGENEQRGERLLHLEMENQG